MYIKLYIPEGKIMLAVILTTRNSSFFFISYPTNFDYGIYYDHTLFFYIHYLNLPRTELQVLKFILLYKHNQFPHWEIGLILIYLTGLP